MNVVVSVPLFRGKRGGGLNGIFRSESVFGLCRKVSLGPFLGLSFDVVCCPRGPGFLGCPRVEPQDSGTTKYADPVAKINSSL